MAAAVTGAVAVTPNRAQTVTLTTNQLNSITAAYGSWQAYQASLKKSGP